MASPANIGVVLLASEWGSKRPGEVSTFNRELAIHLAKQPEVNVSVLVPRCDQEEKSAAYNNNVTLIQATRRPGFNEIHWLSFPPDDLQIDFIIGHGVELGCQAQIIKHQRHCKWIQFVHTDPEELGMFKDDPSAISKAEKKHQEEVDLCKMADCVVAVGPKMAEAYSSYLRSCGKDQDIFVLTPGIFSEFADVVQSKQDGRMCRVLAFGHGSAEDFSLKGFDIAAKAVAKLDDVHLIFVGAQNNQHSQIASRLKEYSIPSSRLRVRALTEIKDAQFSEVDLAIMPSRTDGFGLAALQAMSAGLPVLVSSNSGFGEALQTVRFGSQYVISSDEDDDWAEKIKEVWRKPRRLRLDESKSLREGYAEKYKWEEQCKDLVEKMRSCDIEMCEPVDPMSVSEGCAIDPPELKDSVTPPEKKNLPGPGDAKPLEDHHLPVDILLLTAKDCEFLSCLAFLDVGFFNVYHNRLGFLFLGEMGKNEKLKIAVIQCSAGAGGPDGTIIVTTEAVKILRPKAVFCVGFCGSLNREKVKLGDVVLSARLRTYALIKRMASGIQERNISVPLNRRLARLIKSADHGWNAPLTEPGKLKVEVHKNGVFLSGPEVVDEKERREGLIDRFRDAIAIEMEGEGVYAAAHNLNVEWIVIKGVSDYADGKKSATDSWRPFASTMAASLTAHILSNPVVFKDWPHYECVASAPKRKMSSSSRTGDSMKIVTAEPAATKKRKLENKGLAVKPGCPSEEELRLLAKKLANDWKNLASRLNFERGEIIEIDDNNKKLADKATDMLLDWKKRDSTQATYQVLYDALCHKLVQNRLLADEFCCS